MSPKQHARRLIWPVASVVLSLGLILTLPHVDLSRAVEDVEALSMGVTVAVYFSLAWLASRLLAMVLDQATTRRRPYPRLLKDLIAAVLFLLAFAASVAMFMGQGAVGALAGSGLVLAMLGFAIRNVVADTLSGIALGIEGPFRIGDWIDIDGLARGKVIEIGWRTTRVLTRDSTYLILPNSQIARQRITNYSAPRPQYRAQVAIILDHSIPIDLARKTMLAAVKEAKLIQQDPPPDVRVLSYEEGGIAYALRYWLTRFDRDVDCRDEVYSLLDNALRQIGDVAPRKRVELIGPEIAAPHPE
ncbi:mechanosensitive ion channel family protein [Roseovarius sp. M141]|uniref:mechanosensitive ion channel family protein n=1 Tax=Roseovarius sp. M141 TaxID=2583806 RepID=UPI0020CE8F6A|nr:mechanosensitive ion channel domain-containing protein [Roseovarius sp. M141]MCQ0093161.1 mechanosensitive ion channel [Roseovarius sp. M141]